MKYVFFAIIFLILILGCGNDRALNDNTINDPVNGNNALNDKDMTNNNINNDNGPINSLNDENSNDGMNAKKTSSKETMKFCTNEDSSPVVYKYYYTEDKIYMETSTEGSGKLIKAMSQTKTCLKNLEDNSWNCVDSTMEDFNSEMDMIHEQTEGAMAPILKMKCSTMDYNKGLFEALG